jgi:hypothetical protein
VINAIQHGISAGLDLQAIAQLVGDKVRELFRTGNVNIAWWDDKTDQVQVVYRYEHGKPLPLPPPWTLGSGPVAEIIRKREPRVANTRAEQTAAGIGPAPGTDWAHSIAGVPIVGSNRVLGLMSLQNHEREYAYSADDVRLLQTIAASMGGALENARLLDATQHLLKETEQRNAELAVINSIQQGVAAELTFQGIVDLVGDKLREVLATANIGIRWFEPDTGLIRFLYEYEHGERLHIQPMARVPGGPGEVMERTRQPMVLNTPAERRAAGIVDIPGTDPSLVGDLRADPRPGPPARRDRSRRSSARERLRRGRGAPARHRRRGHGRRSRERAIVRRDAAAAQGDRAAQRRVGGDQFDPARHRPPSSTSRRSSISSETNCARCSRPATSESRGGTRTPTGSRTSTRTSTAFASLYPRRPSGRADTPSACCAGARCSSPTRARSRSPSASAAAGPVPTGACRA